ncbi:bacteriocin secretion accessory protein [Weissella paramesenteroides]|nr:bacteriocin secretion accessory protein [Weissella paramesenteroides]KAA8437470.1 bacteriocin secretion accessory protein [Weissella paramesenteroides]
MVEYQDLESGEFYQRRYRNFPTLIIFPTLLLIVFIVLFSFFLKREIIAKFSGAIIPEKIITDVQSTSDNMICTNQLEENKVVNKGDILVTFKNENEKSEIQNGHKKIISHKEHLRSLNVYKRSIIDGRNQFNGVDKFGYDRLFHGYISQINNLNNEFEQQQIDKKIANQQLNEQIDVLRKIQRNNQNKISDFKSIMDAVTKSTKMDADNQYKFIYDDYYAQFKSTQIMSEKVQIKENMISSILQKIEQLQATNDSYDIQIAGVLKNNFLSKNSTLDKITNLQQQQLATIQKEINKQQQILDELEVKQSMANQHYQDTVLKSPKKGILHLINNKSRMTYLPKGTTIAQIYPLLTRKTKLNIESYIAEKDITGLKKGQKIKFIVKQNGSKILKLKGTVKTISDVPTDVKEGSFYKCVANIFVDGNERKQIKYGLNGEVIIIKGTKTWFNYYKDILLGRDFSDK